MLSFPNKQLNCNSTVMDNMNFSMRILLTQHRQIVILNHRYEFITLLLDGTIKKLLLIL